MAVENNWISSIKEHKDFNKLDDEKKNKYQKIFTQLFEQLSIAENKNEVEAFIHTLLNLSDIHNSIKILFLQQFILHCNQDKIKSKVIEIYLELDGITPMRPFLEKLLISTLDNDTQVKHPKSILSIVVNIHIPFLIDQTANKKNILSYFLDIFLMELMQKDFKERDEVIARSIQTLELLEPGTEACLFLVNCIRCKNEDIILNALNLIKNLLKNKNISDEHKKLIYDELKKQMKNKLDKEILSEDDEIWKIQKLKTEILAQIDEDLCTSFVEEIL